MIDELNVHNFLEVFRNYNGQIFGYVYLRVAKNRAVAEDLTQEIFIKAWQNRTRFDARKANIKTWLYVIAHNSVVDHWRKTRVGTVSLDNTITNQLTVDTIQLDDTSLLADFVYTQLCKLEPQDQDLITWRYIQELEIEEIAEILNKNYNTTKVAIHRALQKLKQLINEAN